MTKSDIFSLIGGDGFSPSFIQGLLLCIFIKGGTLVKKLLSMILVLVFVLSIAPFALADDVIELNMYFPVSVGGGPDQLISALCDEFHAENPDIKINPI